MRLMLMYKIYKYQNHANLKIMHIYKYTSTITNTSCIMHVMQISQQCIFGIQYDW
jgi:hypothetical protein